MKKIDFISRFTEPSDEQNTAFDNDGFIDDITKIEEEGDYDWYNFFPDSAF